MEAKLYTTNEYGELSERTVTPGASLSGVKTLTKAEKTPLKGFLGFGVAITGSSCYNLSLMEKSDRKKLLTHLYSKAGLGFGIGRLSIGASDYSAEIYSYDDTENDTELKDFSIDRDKKYIIPIIKEILEINPELILFASPWSPPGWMKTGGSIGGGYMRREYIDCYADYFVKFIGAYAEEGINIYAVTPQNEPETQQNGGKMPACIWHPDIEAEFIAVLRKKFDQNGIKTKIWGYDHNFAGTDRVLWTLNEHPETAAALDGVAFHYYEGAVEQTTVIKEKYPDLSLHFSEGGPRLYDNYATDWCKWTLMMIKALSCGYSSFTGWNLMLDEMGGPNVGPFFCGGLITRNSLSGELSFSGQYKAFRHFAPFVKPYSKVYPLELSENFDSIFSYNGKKDYAPAGCVIEDPDGTETLVLVNPAEAKAQLQYFKDNKWWYIELLPKTSATVVFKD